MLLTNAGLTTALAWVLACATLFFVGLGLRDEQDIFLLLGTACVFFANLFFDFHLRSQRQGSGGLIADLVDGANGTQSTFFACSAAAVLYAFAHQVALVRARGCGDEEEGDDGGVGAEQPRKQQQHHHHHHHHHRPPGERAADGASGLDDEAQELLRLRAALADAGKPQPPAAALRRRE